MTHKGHSRGKALDSSFRSEEMITPAVASSIGVHECGSRMDSLADRQWDTTVIRYDTLRFTQRSPGCCYWTHQTNAATIMSRATRHRRRFAVLYDVTAIRPRAPYTLRHMPREVISLRGWSIRRMGTTDRPPEDSIYGTVNRSVSTPVNIVSRVRTSHLSRHSVCPEPFRYSLLGT
jgi:hypothetical protein